LGDIPVVSGFEDASENTPAFSIAALAPGVQDAVSAGVAVGLLDVIAGRPNVFVDWQSRTPHRTSCVLYSRFPVLRFDREPTLAIVDVLALFAGIHSAHGGQTELTQE